MYITRAEDEEYKKGWVVNRGKRFANITLGKIVHVLVPPVL